MAGGSSETVYCILKHLEGMLPRCPGVFDDEYRQFFTRWERFCVREGAESCSMLRSGVLRTSGALGNLRMVRQRGLIDSVKNEVYFDLPLITAVSLLRRRRAKTTHTLTSLSNPTDPKRPPPPYRRAFSHTTPPGTTSPRGSNTPRCAAWHCWQTRPRRKP